MIIDGKIIAANILAELRLEIDELKRDGVSPGLAVIKVGNDPASGVYVRNKKKVAEELGMHSRVIELGGETSEEELLDQIERLNDDEGVHGILVQLPLPRHIDEKKVVEKIDPRKDVDCFHPENFGRAMLGDAVFYPCTPSGILELLRRSGTRMSGKNCVVVGRSNIVGKPVAIMMSQEGATATICHSQTADLAAHTRNADILIVAVGKGRIITRDMVKPGAVVIDVGINRLPDGKIVGDVDYENVKEMAGRITPVPGGVGPMTIAMLMKNTVEAAKRLG